MQLPRNNLDFGKNSNIFVDET